MDDGGEYLTRNEAVAWLLWQYALGFEEKDPDNNDKTIKVKPQRWAIELLWDRLEGKAPSAVHDDKGTLTAADKVSDQAVSRMNKIAAETVGAPKPGGPPRFERGVSDSDDG